MSARRTEDRPVPSVFSHRDVWMNGIHKCTGDSFGSQETAEVAVPPASNGAVHSVFLGKPESLFSQSVFFSVCDYRVFKETPLRTCNLKKMC